MSFPDITSDLKARLPQLRGRLIANQSLGEFAWFRVGGPAQALFMPEDEDDLAYVLRNMPAEIPVTVIVAPVYSAGEQPIPGIDRDTLVQGLRAHGHRQAMALEAPEKLAGLIKALAKPGDYVVCLGAGSITQWAYALPAELKAL